ncbi:TonB-dependent receptor [Alteromonas lipolytica]|uniref:TonB-dependent receptor n=1 Tax=Alteromonas lipolytica TaxID=1856405 RepID=A0A1E8FLF2_9ALTE|nr:TonB-dependent receptor [Alteromonas lipolytica]OFI36263.1 hypothetical protein BFC17_09075 [Alteromonas lipolytica]
MRTTCTKTMRLSIIAGVIISALQPALAQEEEKGADNQIEKIEVTARKRSESIQEIPLAVSALISDDIEKRGIIQVSDLADNAPGLVVSNNYSGKTDRSVQTFILRGFTPSGSQATTSMFIDGVPVSSTTAVSSIGSPERIEILRGPQAAYFGRNTFAGAVNVVNKEPNKEWAGSVEATVGNYSYARLRGEIEGTLIDDKLAFRASIENYEKDGAWDNHGADGGTLGDQKTTMGNLYILATPTEDLTIKAFGFYSHDDDGPAASALVAAYNINDYSGNRLVSAQSNCEINGGNPYICGELPAKVDPLSYNTRLPEDSVLKVPSLRLTDLDINDYGMERETYHAHLVVDYDIAGTDFSVSSLTGVNNEEWVIINDIDHYYSSDYNFAYMSERRVEDFSQELRLSYAGDGPLTGTVGLSYLDAESQTGAAYTIFQPFFDYTFAPAQGGTAFNKTTGLFFGLSYELSDKATLSAEGRYQRDKVSSETATGALEAEATYNNFLPRVIVDYKFTDDLMAYATYSKGVNPSRFNTVLSTYLPEVRAAAEEAGITLAVQPEEVDNFEIGVKGTALGGSMTYVADVYFADWTNQTNQLNGTIMVDGFQETYAGYANTGGVEITGLEGELNWMITSNLRLNASGAYIGSDIQEFTSVNLTRLVGYTDFSGNEMPGVSKQSGNIGLQYSDYMGDYDYFARVDYSYKSGMYTSEANLTETPDIHKVNLRAGVTFGNLSVQAYVKNVFDNDDYTYARDYNILGYPEGVNSGFAGYTAILGSLQEPRTVGLTVKYTFSEY